MERSGPSPSTRTSVSTPVRTSSPTAWAAPPRSRAARPRCSATATAPDPIPTQYPKRAGGFCLAARRPLLTCWRDEFDGGARLGRADRRDLPDPRPHPPLSPGRHSAGGGPLTTARNDRSPGSIAFKARPPFRRSHHVFGPVRAGRRLAAEPRASPPLPRPPPAPDHGLRQRLVRPEGGEL